MPGIGNKELTKRQFFTFSTLCCLVYFTSYITRINYGAAISEIVDSLKISNQLAGMAVTGSFITYGVGQPICGFLGDRIKPRNMIFIGLLATAICNLTISFMSNINLMIFIWCFNGLFQAMLWPPLVRIMAQTLSDVNYRKASIGVATAASAGTIAVYLLVPFCILISGWRLSFIIPAIVGFLIALVWFFGVKEFTVPEPKVEEISIRNPVLTKTSTLIFASGLLPIMLVIMFQGALRDGITTWMPTYIQDVYHLSSSISILSTAILPIFTIVSVIFATFVQRLVKNELKTSTYIWGTGFIACMVLITLFASNAVVSITFMAIITGCMHGINLMLLSYLPLHFEKYGRVSTMSGILNSFTYLGSAISIYGIATLSEHLGWKFTIISWSVIAFMGTIICALCVRRWKRFTSEPAKFL